MVECSLLNRSLAVSLFEQVDENMRRFRFKDSFYVVPDVNRRVVENDALWLVMLVE